MATLLEMAQRITRRLNLTSEPSVVVGSTDPAVKQFLEFFQEEGDELRGRHEWSKLRKAWSITMTTSETQEQDYPTDFDRLAVRAEFWRSDTDITPLVTISAPDQWHLISQTVGTSPGYWRRWEDGVQIMGVAEDVVVTTEYLSTEWVAGESEAQASWEADTDTSKLPDNLLMLGVRWRWKQSKGMDYAEDMASYERELMRQIMNDTQMGTISLGGMDDMRRNRTWPGIVTES